MQKTLIILGLLLISIGLAWPWLSALPFGRLPGDLALKHKNITFYFPLTTAITISILLSIIVWLLRK
ncbi:DUF2905 domain-containing protein [Colwelliaceae bacterium 6471]